VDPEASERNVMKDCNSEVFPELPLPVSPPLRTSPRTGQGRWGKTVDRHGWVPPEMGEDRFQLPFFLDGDEMIRLQEIDEVQVELGGNVIVDVPRRIDDDDPGSQGESPFQEPLGAGENGEEVTPG